MLSESLHTDGALDQSDETVSNHMGLLMVLFFFSPSTHIRGKWEEDQLSKFTSIRTEKNRESWTAILAPLLLKSTRNYKPFWLRRVLVTIHRVSYRHSARNRAVRLFDAAAIFRNRMGNSQAHSLTYTKRLLTDASTPLNESCLSLKQVVPFNGHA